MASSRHIEADRRYSPRLPSFSDVAVYFQIEGRQQRHEAGLSDISYPFMGLKLVSHAAVPPESPVKLELVTDKGEPITRCEGVIAWCRASVSKEGFSSPVYQVGISVEAENANAQQVLDRQILRLIPLRLNELLYTRLKTQSTGIERHFSQHGLKYTEDLAMALAPLLDLNYRFALLLEMIAKMNSTLLNDENRLLTRIMEAAREIMNSEASSLMLLDKATDELVIQIPTGPVQEEVAGIRIPRGQGFAGWVAEHDAPLLVEEATTDPRHYQQVDQDSGFETKSLICVPMRGPNGEIMGVLEAMNPRDEAPYTQADIDLLSVLADQAAIGIENARLHTQELEKQRLEQQLTLAQHIQESFLPGPPPEIPGISLAGISQPALQIGGDYYHYGLCPDGNLSLVVADVSGKDVPAAMLMASFQSTLKAHAQFHHSVAETVGQVNNAIYRETPDDKFLTLVYAHFDPVTRRLIYTNGGHNLPLLYRSRDGSEKQLDIGGMIIGFLPDIAFEQGCETLEAGDILVIHTDGVTDAMNVAEEPFGEERLYAVVRANHHLDAQRLVQCISEAVKEFAQGAKPFDDMTLLVLKVESNA